MDKGKIELKALKDISVSRGSVPAFNYKFSDVDGINFEEYLLAQYEGDLLIYYSSMATDQFIDGWCTRWDSSNYTITIETFLSPSEFNTLISNITPGAVGELYKVLGEPHHYDKTWTGGNTLKILPNNYTAREAGGYTGDLNSNLENMRDERIVYVKNVTTSPVANTDEYINIKIEGLISGTTI